MSLIVKIGKKGKKIVKKFIAPAEKPSLSYTRRLERVKTDRSEERRVGKECYS